jgi:hypothetical protein
VREEEHKRVIELCMYTRVIVAKIKRDAGLGIGRVT